MTEETNERPPMPANIAKGIVQVQAAVKRLARQDKNDFAKYDYASIDTFLEAVGPLEAEAGLFTIMDEASTEVADKSLSVEWLIWICHASGDMYGPLHRTVQVPAAGAQAYGSSQSYTLKQFLRGLYKIPTGDKDDPDAGPKHDLSNKSKKPPAQIPAKEEIRKPDATYTLKHATAEAAMQTTNPGRVTVCKKIREKLGAAGQEVIDQLKLDVFFQVEKDLAGDTTEKVMNHRLEGLKKWQEIDSVKDATALESLDRIRRERIEQLSGATAGV